MEELGSILYPLLSGKLPHRIEASKNIPATTRIVEPRRYIE